ncbi:hypothetical protein MKX01_026121 [Papaver californicum]|nr:hypothetical protein MKX01_026121 [Papaver californicum]
MKLDAEEYDDLYADTRRDPDFGTRMLRVESPFVKAKHIESLKSSYAGIIYKSEIYLHLKLIYDSQAVMRDYEMLIYSNTPYRKINWNQFFRSSGISIK